MSDAFESHMIQWLRQRQHEDIERLKEQRRKAVLTFLRSQGYVVQIEQLGYYICAYDSAGKRQLTITMDGAGEIPTEHLITWIKQRQKEYNMPTWNIPEHQGTAPTKTQYSAGGAQHPTSHLWQLWVTLDGQHINWLAAYRDPQKIDAAMLMFKRQANATSFFDPNALRALFDQLYASREADPQPLPAAEAYIRSQVAGTGTWGKDK